MNRGRPKLNICALKILGAIRRHGTILAAARELGCSDAYVHIRLKRFGLSLQDVLDASDITALLQGSNQE
jgi:molybdenum-dependent DNA-binding transcriptional regulator ModE